MKDKKKSILFCVLIFVSICLYSFLLKVDVGDEIINMQSIVKMLNGNLIYKDFNVIITPLFFYLGKIFLSFADNILAFRISCSLVTCSISLPNLISRSLICCNVWFFFSNSCFSL